MHDDIEEALQRIREQVEDEDFEGVQSHTLALALSEWFNGDLVAILRHQVDDAGTVHSTTYSHMVCVAGGRAYDINGGAAVDRWTARWPAGPSDQGLLNEFEQVVLSAESLPDFLADFDGVPVDPLLEQALVAALADEQPLLISPGMQPAA